MKKLLGISALALLAMGLSTMSVQAAGTVPTPPAPTETLIAVQAMQVDCPNLSASAMQYAIAHQLCTTAGAIPNNKVGGNCGDSFLYMSDADNGNARFRYGFDSTQGAVVFRNLTVTWANWTRGVVGNFPDEIAMFNAHYSNTVNKYTKQGFVTGVEYGDVLLWWGGICTLLDPTSSASVTW